MRLTLRTLLAYLDNTLDPQDAEALKSKLSQSGFATQLVQRLQTVLRSGTLSAPSPEAMGPVEEPNVIGEYLDSTLPVEQVAEIERACLESDAHLAEAAACHQILTIVLKQPAGIPQELRQRIYELPDRQMEDIAAGGSFSGVTIPQEGSDRQMLGGDLPTSETSFVRDSKPIQPVGPDDSGVSDAPTRLRQAEVGMTVEGSPAAIAGASPRSVDQDSRIYGGSIRTSRITPWLVSLGLAAVLLFVLSQLFRPLFERPVSDLSEQVAEVPSDASGGAAGQAAASDEDLPSDSTQPSDAKQNEVDDQDATASGEAEAAVTPDVDSDASSDLESDQTTTSDETPMPAEDVEKQTDSQTGADETATEAPPEPKTDVDPGADSDAKGATVADSQPDVSAPPPPPPQPPKAGDVAEDADQPMPSAEADEDRTEVAQMISADSLVTALVDGNWVRMKQGASIVHGVPIVCAPTFRDRIATSIGELTMVGPSQIEWVANKKDQMTLSLDFGKLLIAAQEADVQIPIRIGAEILQLHFDEPDTIAALSVSHFRAPGFDPLQPENRIPLTSVIAVQGGLTIESDGKKEEMQSGGERKRRGVGEPEIVTLEAMPAWVSPAESPLEASARDGLLQLLDGSQPLELQLREATVFRRSEVAALAGRTLLGMGFADVYFGSDGLFNEPKQRTYWPEHFQALLAEVDRSTESAESVHDSIVRMDSANATALLRLLTGFSQKQLTEGADAELVERLDSTSMAVRVFALENLHKITGTTLYFRPDQENSVRRAPNIKKWETRLRKEDIRWTE